MLIQSISYDPSYLVSAVLTMVVLVVMVIKTVKMVAQVVDDGVLEYVKDDWLERLPHRLNTMKFRGLSRPAYTLLCLMYYSIKSVLILVLHATFRVYKFILWDIWVWLFRTDKRAWFRSLFSRDVDDEEEDDPDEGVDEEEPAPADDIEELPFCQLFRIGTDMCLLVDHIEMCPDETAFIRVVDDEGYTPLYKRKVRRDKAGNRFILFNGTNHYLDDSKTQPTSIKK